MSWNTVAYIGAGLLSLSALLVAREHLWLTMSHVVNGTVIELQASSDSDGVTYAPKVRFVAWDGSRHEFTRGYNSNPPGFKVGENVAVAYDPNSYEGRILTFGQRFGLAAITASVGLCLVAMGGSFIVGRSVVPRVYLEHAVANGVEPDRRGF